MLVSAGELTDSERLILDRRRRGESQIQAALRHRVSLYIYRQWEDGQGFIESAVPRPGRLDDGEQCFVMRLRAGMRVGELAQNLGVCRLWLTRMERGTAPVGRLWRFWENNRGHLLRRRRV